MTDYDARPTVSLAPHRPIMPVEVLSFLRPMPGELALDCTLGGGGHAELLIPRLQPGGRLVGVDIDTIELPRTETRLRAAGFGEDVFTAVAGSYRDLPEILASMHVERVDLLVADLGISSMQSADAARGFSYKVPGPLDMRMNPARSVSASDLLSSLKEEELAGLLTVNSDEPHAALIAKLLKDDPPQTTQALERRVRIGLETARADLSKAAIKMSVRRTFQALRIAVNDEFAALDALLRDVPALLRDGGRVVVLTFHSGEDRRVKQAFRSGYRAGDYSAVARRVTRPSVLETRANRRASSAKLRWALRAGA